ncbi:Sucraseferredoxin-like protein [Scheffersomyces amazonensis]|uniref:Sucraseferredoxin-like protein n=1 Tax=Scheffersomyces amazonensis TaxID=1078765 RepID=UPI00315D5360
MTSTLIRRLHSKARFVPTCPKPEYDTGCTFCRLPEFPADKQIDMDRNLASTKTAPWKHVLILSHGIKDFNTMPAKIELIPESLSSNINHLKNGRVSAHHPILVSNILLQSHEQIMKAFGVDGTDKNEQLVYLYPDNKVLKFDISKTVQFITKYLTPPDHQLEAVYNPFKVLKQAASSIASKPVSTEDDTNAFTEYPLKKNLVLICGHTQRDVRCGKLAPLLQDEFSRVLENENLDKETELGLISHIGGHAYAGNVIYFPKDTQQNHGIWYGRVFPEKVQGIVKETMLNGNIIQDLYRGDV